MSKSQPTDWATLQKQLESACTLGCAETVSMLLENTYVNPGYSDNAAIRTASRRGHLQVVQALLADGRANPRAMNDLSIRQASWEGHTAVVRALLADGRANPRTYNSWSLWNACRRGHLQVVRVLLADGRADRRVASQPCKSKGRGNVLRACVTYSAWFAVLAQSTFVRKAQRAAFQ